MSLVVDASVAVRWYVDGSKFESARNVLTANETLIAPDLLIPEFCNAMWQIQRVGQISVEQGQHAIRHVATVFMRLYSSIALRDRAYAIAMELDHPAYDCFYLALADAEDCRLVTADRRLVAATQHTEWSKRLQALGPGPNE